MRPTLLEADLLGSHLSLGSYATFMMFAWAAGIAVGTYAAHRAGLRWRSVAALYALALFVGVVGARLFDLGIAWRFYADDPSRIWALSFSGFSLYGGLVTAGLVGLALAKRWGLDAWRLGDSAIWGIAIGVVLMRVGCFMNGCCFGEPTSLPWGVTYPSGSGVWVYQLATEPGVLGLLGEVKPVHPTQLYEAGGAVLLLATSSIIGRRVGRDGVTLLLFAAGFTLVRLANGLLRARQPVITAPEWFYPVFYLTLATLFLLMLRRTPPEG